MEAQKEAQREAHDEGVVEGSVDVRDAKDELASAHILGTKLGLLLGHTLLTGFLGLQEGVRQGSECPSKDYRNMNLGWRSTEYLMKPRHKGGKNSRKCGARAEKDSRTMLY